MSFLAPHVGQTVFLYVDGPHDYRPVPAGFIPSVVRAKVVRVISDDEVVLEPQWHRDWIDKRSWLQRKLKPLPREVTSRRARTPPRPAMSWDVVA